MSLLNKIFSFLNQPVFGKGSSKPAADLFVGYGVDELEDRYMLSGDFSAFEVGSSLFLYGDAEANDLEVTTVNNLIEISGASGTTIDGSATITSSAQNLFVFLGGGDNRFHAEELSIAGSLFVFGGNDDDLISIVESSIGDRLTVHTLGGSDRIGLNGVSTSGGVFINSGLDDDLISLRDSEIGSNLFVRTGGGDDATVVEDSAIGLNTFLIQQSGNDEIAWSSSTVGENFFAFTGLGDDAMRIEDSTVGDRSFMFLGRGDDQSYLAAGNRFTNRVYLFGGKGQDQIENQSTPGQGQRLFQTEIPVVDMQLLSDRFDAAGGVIERSNQLQNKIAPQPLVIDVSANNPVESVGTLLVADPAFVISGTTFADASIVVEINGNAGPTTTADSNGNFSVTANLIHDSNNFGANELNIVSTSTRGRTASEMLDVHLAIDDVVRLETTLGNIDMEMLSSDVPLNSQNFLNYLNRYANTIVHRSARTASGGDFVIQGGGFTFENGAVNGIVTDPPVVGENATSASNVRGTVALALPGSINGTLVNGGTSQWFINMNDNLGLDSDFTVFARVIGDGLLIADAIHALSTFDISGDFGNPALGEVPLIGYDNTQTADEDNFVFVNRAFVVL